MDYTSIKIPKELASEIDSVLEMGYGYTSRPEFVKDAIRKLLLAMKKEPNPQEDT